MAGPAASYTDRERRRFPTMFGLAFATGIPFPLVSSTLSAWLTDAGLSVATIGLLSSLTLPYKLKFIWAPFLERRDAPILGHLLGRRRGWIVLSQLGTIMALAGIAVGDPAHRLAWTIAFCLALAFSDATQAVTVDGWRINAASSRRQAPMASIAQVAWRIGNVAAGAGALYLADRAGWRAAYLCMAMLILPGLVAAVLAPGEPDPAEQAMPPQSIVTTIVVPIRELANRLGSMAVPVILMVIVFRMPGYLSSAMNVPLFKSLHYSNSDIATATKVVGFWVALGGTALASFVVPRIGMMGSLLSGTVVASASHLALAWLAAHGDHGGKEFWTFCTAISIDGFAYSFATIILITYTSSIVTRDHAASQFALLTSLVALPGLLFGSLSGVLVEKVGFVWFFVGTSLIGMPIAMLCWWVARGSIPAPAAAKPSA